MRRVLACFAALSAPLMAQEFDAEMSAVSGVSLIAPNSPMYDAAVHDLVPKLGDRTVLSPILPYSVVVKNVGARDIHTIIVRYEYINGTVKNPTGAFIAPQQRGQFAAGAAELFTPSGALRNFIRRDRNAYELALRNLPQVADSLTVRVSLDGIVFEDGEFLGPDKTETFKYLRYQVESFQEVLSEVSAMRSQPDELVQARLEELSRAGTNIVDARLQMTRRATAGSLLHTLKTEGRRRMEQAALYMADSPPFPDIWKR